MIKHYLFDNRFNFNPIKFISPIQILNKNSIEMIYMGCEGILYLGLVFVVERLTNLKG